MEDNYNRRNNNSAVAWVAILVAVIALFISVLAYNRSGEDLGTQINEGVDNTVQELEEATPENAGESAQEATDRTEEAIDNGPDGVDDGAQ